MAFDGPRTFDEVAQEIAKERGITLGQKEIFEDLMEVQETPLSPSVIEEDNLKVRKVMKKLEEHGWHYDTQRQIKLYIDTTKTRSNIINGREKVARTPFRFLHYELNEQLCFYQNAVNAVIKYYDYNFSIRKKLIVFLGCKCLFCGNEDIDYLQLDHKENNGGQERKRFKKHRLNPMLYYWYNLIDAYLKLQVLCIKCHRLKSTYRITQEEIDEKTKEIKS